MLDEQPRYGSYKDSGVDWIGDIPEEWSKEPLRALFTFRNEKNDPVKTEDILSLSIAEGVTPYSEEGRGGNKRKDDLTAYKLAYPGDIVLNSMNVIVGAVGLSRYFGAISPVYYALTPRPGRINVEFYSYVFQNQSFLSGLLRYGKGIMMKLSGTGKLNTIRMKISTSDLKQISFPYPDLDTQNRIVSFLDEKTAEIDAAISRKRRLIDLLNEQKAILINRAVTKGLNPDAPMKNSGVDWIGEIPAHWEVKRNKNLFVEINKRSESGQEQHLSMSQKLGLVPSNLVEKSLESESYEGAKLVEEGDLVLNRLKAHLAVFSVAPMIGVISPDYSVFRLRRKDAVPTYFERLFKTPEYLGEFNRKVKGIVVGFYRLYSDDFMAIPLLVPPVEEQKEISRRLEELAAEFTPAFEKVEQEISTLIEFKQTLIAHAVTGKIKI